MHGNRQAPRQVPGVPRPAGMRYPPPPPRPEGGPQRPGRRRSQGPVQPGPSALQARRPVDDRHRDEEAGPEAMGPIMLRPIHHVRRRRARAAGNGAQAGRHGETHHPGLSRTAPRGTMTAAHCRGFPCPARPVAGINRGAVRSPAAGRDRRAAVNPGGVPRSGLRPGALLPPGSHVGYHHLIRRSLPGA